MQAWPDTLSEYGDRLADQLREDPDGIGLCVAYIGDTPVGSARSSFRRGSWFSGLWGGGSSSNIAGVASTATWSFIARGLRRLAECRGCRSTLCRRAGRS
jgi:hypothetical protein